MGRLCSGFLFPVSCLLLVWAAGSGSIQVLREPTCFSDYISISTCEWQLDRVVNCSAHLRLAYWLDFDYFENRTCVPKNSASSVCACRMLTDNLVKADSYRLDLWTGRRLLWSGSFQPSDHVKPPAPGNLTVEANISNTWLLTWSNPYPSNNILHHELTYLVNISSENDPSEFKVRNVTYKKPFLRLEASTLRPGVPYRVRVRAQAPSYNSTWSEWSPSTRWHNYYQPPLEQRLPLGVTISCVIILVVCLSCYFSIVRIKKVWWDQIPSPALSPLVAVVIQDSQVSLWEKRSQGQEPAKCPRWKTCLAKLLPCLLEHGMKTDEGSPKAAGNGPFRGPGKSVWCPVEVSKTVFWPESISVVQCVEVFEAPVEKKEEEEEEGDNTGDLSALPESSGDSFQEGREGIAARLTADLFLDLLGTDAPSGSTKAPLPWVEEAASQGPGQPWRPEPLSPGSLAHSQVPVVIADNPTYRSCSDFCSRSPSPRQLESGPQLAGHPGAPQAEGDSWEQQLRQCVLQLGAASAGSSLEPGRPSGEVGYKAFSSLLATGAPCPVQGSGSGAGGYRPFQSLVPGSPGDPAPGPGTLFTFGLDMGLVPSPQDLSIPHSVAEPPSLGLGVKAEDGQKPLLPPQQPPEPFRDDLGSGIVYSALTCHLCGHLKQHHSQEEGGQAHVASTGCGCRCGDRASPPGSPLGALGTTPGGLTLEASITPASLAPQGLSEEGKTSLSFQPGPRGVSSSQPPEVLGLVSTRVPGVTVS